MSTNTSSGVCPLTSMHLTHYTHTPTQMLVYTVVQLVEDFESEATKPDAQDMAAGGKVQTVHSPLHG